MVGKAVLVRFLAFAEVKFSCNVLSGVLEKIQQQDFSRRVVPCVYVKCVLVEQELAIHPKSQSPCQSRGVEFENPESKPIARFDFID